MMTCLKKEESIHKTYGQGLLNKHFTALIFVKDPMCIISNVLLA